jgi:hypothetical protein
MREGRITLFVCGGLLIATLWLISPLRGDRLKPFPWFNRGDPRIQTHVFLRGVDLDISGKRIAIYPFDVSPKVQPDLAPFGPVLEQALYQEGTAAVVEYLPVAPWRGPLSPQMKEPTDRERDNLGVIDARSRNADLLVVGRVQPAFRTAGGGLLVNITVRVLSARDGRILWYGRKRADWIRRFPIEDCFLNLAWSLVKDWRSHESR